MILNSFSPVQPSSLDPGSDFSLEVFGHIDGTAQVLEVFLFSQHLTLLFQAFRPIYIVFFLLIFSPLPSNALHHSSSWSCSVWQVSAVSARSSANSSVHGNPELASDPSTSITMTKRKGLRAEPWWSPTFTEK